MKIISNIRKNNLKNTVKYFLLSLLLVIPLIITIIFINKVGKDVTFQHWLLLIVFIVLLIFPLFKFFKYLCLAIKPENSKVFKKYGPPSNVEKIISNAKKNKIYEDYNFIISKDYIYDKGNYETLISCDNVLGAYKSVYTRSGVVLYYKIVITDKYYQSIIIKYSHDADIDAILKIISKICPNAKVGYSKETKDYIKENRVKL